MSPVWNRPSFSRPTTLVASATLGRHARLMSPNTTRYLQGRRFVMVRDQTDSIQNAIHRSRHPPRQQFERPLLGAMDVSLPSQNLRKTVGLLARQHYDAPTARPLEPIT